MFIEIQTIGGNKLKVNPQQITVVRVVPTKNDRYVISISIMPGKELFIKVNGTEYYTTRALAEQVAEGFSDSLSQVIDGTMDSLAYALMWFGNGDNQNNSKEG